MTINLPHESAQHPGGTEPTILAVAYVRMSTEHQQYSTENQLDRIREYAERRNMRLVRVYADEGKSGLSVKGRESLRKLVGDVEAGIADFGAILVYDISRWGRFQDADESGYYEYICRRAGITVHYCAEQFENDGSPTSNIIKSVKRSMAGEYSRELSVKVFQGACRLIQLGYKQGGTAGFGLRRMLVDQNGVSKGVLARGEHKSLQTDRVILVPGPPEEVAKVRWMYQVFMEGLREEQIAQRLNEQGILTDFDRKWTRSTVHQVLTNEKYVGNNVYHRTAWKLKQKHVRNPPNMWIRANNAFEQVVPTEEFAQVQEIILARSKRYSDEDMLTILSNLLKANGRLSGLIIDEQPDAPSSAAYRHRFGSLVSAYRMIGYNPEVDFAFIEINRQLRRLYPEMVDEVVRGLEAIGANVTRQPHTDLLRVDNEIEVSVVLSRCTTTPAGARKWVVRFDEALRPDITIAVRMDSDNQTIQDYYLLPSIDMNENRLRLREDNGAYFDGYRFPSLDFFFDLAKRVPVQEVA